MPVDYKLHLPENPLQDLPKETVSEIVNVCYSHLAMLQSQFPKVHTAIMMECVLAACMCVFAQAVILSLERNDVGISNDDLHSAMHELICARFDEIASNARSNLAINKMRKSAV